MILKKLIFKNKKKLLNRISVSPMCQYSAKSGFPTSWHYRHLSNLILSGAGLVMLESTAVTKKGRISNKDLSIETKKQTNKFKRLIHYLKKPIFPLHVHKIFIILQRKVLNLQKDFY